MKYSSLYIAFALVFLSVACKNKTAPPETPLQDTTAVKEDTNTRVNAHESDLTEELIMDTLLKLPEVVERAAYIEKETKGKRGIKIWTAKKPETTADKYYWMKVGEDNGEGLVTHFNFYVYPDSMRIMYLDVETDRQMSLTEWRRSESGPCPPNCP